MNVLKIISTIFILVLFNVQFSKSETLTIVADETWNSGDAAILINADDGDNVVLGSNTMTIQSSESADDAGDPNSTPEVGDVNGDAGSGIAIINDLQTHTFKISSIELGDNGSFSVNDTSNPSATNFYRIEISGNFILGANSITLIETSASTSQNIVDIDGNVSIGTGSTFNVTTQANDLYLELSGSTINLGDGIILQDAVELANSYVKFDGSNVQTVNGEIYGSSGAGTEHGIIEIDKTSKTATTTFNDKLGWNNSGKRLSKIEIGSNSKAIFKNWIRAKNVTINGTGSFMGQNDDDLINEIQGYNDVENITFGAGSTVILDNSVAAGDTIFTLRNNGSVTTAGSVSIQVPSTFTSGTITFVRGNTEQGGPELGTPSPYASSVLNMSATGASGYNYTVSSNFTGSGLDPGFWNIIITASQPTSAQAEQEIQNLNLSTQGVSSSKETGFTKAWTFLKTDQSIDSEAYTAFNSAISAGSVASARLAEQTVPQMDAVAGSNSVISNVSNSSMNIASARLASVRTNTLLAQYNDSLVMNDAGFNLFDFKDSQVFFKTFGSETEGDSYDNISGFKADTYGFVLGRDKEQDDGSRLGFAYSFSDSDVSGKGSGQSVTKVDTHQLMFYGDKKIDQFLFEGMAGFSDNNNTASRRINQSGLNRVAIGKFNSRSIFTRGSLSRDIKNPFGEGVARLTFGASASNTNNSSYTETGANSLNMNVNPDDTETLVGFTGLKFNKKLDTQSIETKMLELRLGASYDFAGDTSTSIASYTGGGNAFSVDGNPVDQLGVNFGLSYLFFEDAAKKYSLNYDTEIKDHSVSQTLSFDLIYQF